MVKNVQERREFPRSQLSFPIKVNPNILGETLDLSEGGVKFSSEKPLELFHTQASIEISKNEVVDTEFVVKWMDYLEEENKFIYGVRFLKIEGNGSETIKKVLGKQ